VSSRQQGDVQAVVDQLSAHGPDGSAGSGDRARPPTS
jgi:hypothetical protein